MSSNCDGGQSNSALSALKQRAQAAPTLTEQQPNVLYTMPMQTVERLEEVLRRTLALQDNIRTAMDSLATKESLEAFATAELLAEWLNKTEDLNQQKVQSTETILSEMRSGIRQDGKKRDEFTSKLSDVEREFRRNGAELMNSFRGTILLTSLASGVIATVVSILMWRLMEIGRASCRERVCQYV